MVATDSILLQKMVADINLYLDDKQHCDSLWTQIEMHLQMSYVAENLGEVNLVPKHLAAAARLLVEANHMQQQMETHWPQVQ